MKTASEILLTKAEGQDFDRKAAGINLRDLANILVAFANADGGTVAIGIKNKQFEGINHLDAHRINDFKQVGYDLIHPALKVETEFQKVTINGKENRILLLTVKSSDRHIFYNSKDDVR